MILWNSVDWVLHNHRFNGNHIHSHSLRLTRTHMQTRVDRLARWYRVLQTVLKSVSCKVQTRGFWCQTWHTHTIRCPRIRTSASFNWPVSAHWGEPLQQLDRQVSGCCRLQGQATPASRNRSQIMNGERNEGKGSFWRSLRYNRYRYVLRNVYFLWRYGTRATLRMVLSHAKNYEICLDKMDTYEYHEQKEWARATRICPWMPADLQGMGGNGTSKLVNLQLFPQIVLSRLSKMQYSFEHSELCQCDEAS